MFPIKRKGNYMAPKFKFTKEEILEATFMFIKENGVDKVTARDIAKELSSSTKVIFSLFGNMENLLKEVRELSKNEFLKKIDIALKDEKPFRRLGIEYILFAKNNQRLFQWLFMNKGVEIESFKDFLPIQDYNYRMVIESIVDEYNITERKAEKLYEHLFIYSHGIATLTVTSIYNFKEDEVINLTTEVTHSLIRKFLMEGD